MRLIFFIGLGSFLGGIARFLLSRWFQGLFLSSFPYGTLLVNVLGSFLIGSFYGIFNRLPIIDSQFRMFLTVGFCGGFTTFSTFANENILFLRDANFYYFFLYIFMSLFLCLIATYLGYVITKLI